MVIAHGHDHAAMGGCARHIGMAHHVARPVHAGAFAVPQAKDAVILALAAQFRLLAAPKGGRGQIFVQTKLKGNLRRLQHVLGAGHLHIDRTQRRSAIARHIACCVQTRLFIAGTLHQHQSHQSLRTIEQDLILAQVITIIKGHILMAHFAPPRALNPSPSL